MKTQTLTVKGQYSASNYTLKGSKKEILTHLREEAGEKRRESRLLHRLDDNVHSIDSNLHQSRLVTMASFDLNKMNANQIIELLNNHGVIKYSLN